MSRIYIFIFLFVLPISVFSQFYVAKDGLDSNIGSEASPWLTIQHGVNQLTPGDILYIKEGSYFEKIDIDVSGTASAKITIKKFQNDIVILDGSTSANDNAMIWTNNAYLRIEGLHITKNIINFASGIALQDVAHDIEIINNKVSEIKFSSNPNDPVSSNTNAVPISIYADHPTDSIHHITIAGNEVFNNRTGYSENISAGGNFTDFVIENNVVHDNTNIGIDIGGNYGTCPTPALDHGRNGVIQNNITYNNFSPYSPAAGIYIDGGHNIIVENNLSNNNGYGGEIGCEENGTTNLIIFRNNIFHHNVSSGFHFGGYDANTTGTVTNSQIYNNTFYHNDTNNNGHGELLLTKSEDGKIFNNIFYLNAQDVFLYADRTQTNLHFDYNLVYSSNGTENTVETTINGDNGTGGDAYTGLADFYLATGYGANSLFNNPEFLNIATNDFHLLSNSPAINAGDPSHTPDPMETDTDNQPRAVGITDIGADEYATPLPVEYLSPFQGVVRGNGVKLFWSTALEINASHFVVQRLINNHEWVDVQVILAGRRNYQVIDKNPNLGVNIYRLKQHDMDGQVNISNMTSVVWAKQPKTQLFPNPASKTTFFSDGKSYSVVVKNILGQTVFLSENTNKIELDDKGYFMVYIFDKSETLLQSIPLLLE